MNFTDNNWKDKMTDKIQNMQVPEGIFEKQANRTSERLVDKYFEPTTKNDTRKQIDTVYAQVLQGGKGKIQHARSRHSW